MHTFDLDSSLLSSTMERVTLLCAPASRAGKLWLALHLPLGVMAFVVGAICTVAAPVIVIEREYHASSPDHSPVA